MDAHLLLELADGEGVAVPERAVGIHEELRHDEERDALDPGGRAGGAGEDEVDDVLRQVVVAGGDEDLLPGDAVAAVALRLGAGAQHAEVGAGMRLGQVHRAGPLARDHLRQPGRLLLGRPVRVDRRVGAVGQARIHAERHVGARVHLADGGVQHVGDALAAVLGVAVEPGPAAFAQEVEGLPEAGRGADHAVLEHAALAVADGVEGCEHVARDLARLLEDRGGEVAVEVGVAGDRARLHLEHVVQHEGHVAQRGSVGSHRCRS